MVVAREGGTGLLIGTVSADKRDTLRLQNPWTTTLHLGVECIAQGAADEFEEIRHSLQTTGLARNELTANEPLLRRA